MEVRLDEYSKEKYAPVIEQWDYSVKHDQRFKSIFKYILENGIYFTISELIKVSHDFVRYGEEVNKAFFLLNEKNEVLGFIIAGMTFDEKSLLVREVAIHPDFQGQGVAAKGIKQLIKCSKKLFGEEPDDIHAYIDKTNKNSIKLFKKLGFEMKANNKSKYFKAENHCPYDILEK